MADIDMADSNGIDQARLYLDAVQAQLGERVTNLGRRQTDLEQEMRTGFRQIEQSIAGLSSTLSERAKPQWQAIGVALTFAVIIGGMAYWPIRETTTDLKSTVSTLAAETNQTIRMLADRTVSRAEMDWRAARGSEDRVRSEAAVADIRASMLPRNEWSERNLNRDHEILAIREAQTRDVEHLQRQQDQLRGEFQTFANSLGNGRDFIQDLKDEVSRLRDQLAEIRARQFQFGGRTRMPQ